MITAKWQLKEAKSRLSELVRRAREEGPQIITLRGGDAVVVVDVAEFDRLTNRPKDTLVEFLRASPLVGADLERCGARCLNPRTRMDSTGPDTCTINQ